MSKLNKIIFATCVLSIGGCQTPARQIAPSPLIFSSGTDCHGAKFRLKYEYESPVDINWQSDPADGTLNIFYTVEAFIPGYPSDYNHRWNNLELSPGTSFDSDFIGSMGLRASEYTDTNDIQINADGGNSLYVWDSFGQSWKMATHINAGEKFFGENIRFKKQNNTFSESIPYWPATNGYVDIGSLVVETYPGSNYSPEIEFKFHRRSHMGKLDATDVCPPLKFQLGRSEDQIRYYMPNIEIVAAVASPDTSTQTDLVTVYMQTKDNWAMNAPTKANAYKGDPENIFFDEDNGYYAAVVTKLSPAQYFLSSGPLNSTTFSFIGDESDIYDNIDNGLYPGPNTTPVGMFASRTLHTAHGTEKTFTLSDEDLLAENGFTILYPNFAEDDEYYAIFYYYKMEDGSQERISNIFYFKH